MILIYYKTWIYQCLIKQVKSPSTWFRVPNSVRIRHSGRAGNQGVIPNSCTTELKWPIYGRGDYFRPYKERRSLHTKPNFP